ncbi:beta-lactamase family protein, partial [bacterium]|nr:beta-lactamase family protein [bacterium]
MCHSVRKSFLSAVYGTHVDDGSIDLDKSLADLSIDDKDVLTDAEKHARVRDLLKARSGVYHPAAYETAGMKRRRPKRGSHKPDSFWYYNNWDFNVLCTILERETGTDIFVDFKNRIADPIGMEDFRLMDGYHHLEAEHSNHPAYPFRMSARDMARFGLLYLRQGQWNGKQIISKRWIDESTMSYSDAGNRGGYGYLWWISGDFKSLGMYSALGVGTQMISVLPKANLVIVQRVDTYARKRVKPNNRLFNMIINAKVRDAKTNPELIPLPEVSSHADYLKLSQTELEKYETEFTLFDGHATIKITGDELLLDATAFGKFKLRPLSRSKFLVEDAHLYLIFDFDGNGAVADVRLNRTEGSTDQ